MAKRKKKLSRPPRKVYPAGNLACTIAKLTGGPCDGEESLSSHGSVLSMSGEHYCHVEYNGDPPDVFRHSNTYLEDNTPGGVPVILQERAAVEKWMEDSHKEVLAKRLPIPMAVLIPIPPTRIGVHWSMIRAGAEYKPTNRNA